MLHGDGGGKAPAIARPLFGRDRVSRAFKNWAKQGLRLAAQVEMRTVNGQPGAVLRTSDGLVLGVVALDIADGRVQEIRNVVNPDKLRHIGPTADIGALLREIRSS